MISPSKEKLGLFYKTLRGKVCPSGYWILFDRELHDLLTTQWLTLKQFNSICEDFEDRIRDERGNKVAVPASLTLSLAPPGSRFLLAHSAAAAAIVRAEA